MRVWVKKRLLVTLLSMFALLGISSPAAAKQPDLDTLKPGAFVTYKQNIPINVVFIGYDKQQVSTSALREQLPKTYDPVVRYPKFYGLEGRDVGLHYAFNYDFTYANKSFADDFFGYLKRKGSAGDLTPFQQQYNDQQHNVLDVTGPVLYIDAPSVEKWLEQQGHARLGVEQHSYTVFFINWYNRDDFKFHVYTKTSDPDPDTGYNFGALRGSRKLIAWGGESGRSWFYDLSAGPEAWANNYNVDDPDLDGNGVDDYRIPPIWEYSSGGYREPSKLSSDLGLVTRYIGINLLFTTSPLYDPLKTTPGLGGRKVVSINVLQDDQKSDGRDFLKASRALKEWRSLEPYYRWKIDVNQTKPIDPGAKRALNIYAGLTQPGPNDCASSPIYGANGELYCYFATNMDKYIPTYKPNDYVAEGFAFNTDDDTADALAGLLGFADDNYINGTQTFVFEFDAPSTRDVGYGFTTTTIHEFGHHIGLSHPHDGYDSETGVDYDPLDQFQFVNDGDESATIMSYIDLTTGFSRFDRDNMYRWEMAGYLNRSNELLARILENPNSGRVVSKLNSADTYAQRSVRAFKNWDYLSAARNAYNAYKKLLSAANTLGVDPIPASALVEAIPGKQAPRLIDPIHPHPHD